MVRTDYFEHVLQLPLSYHTGTHSGRLMKVMLTGTNTLWSLWLAFFREHFASFVSLLVLMPLTLFLNWRFGVPADRSCAAIFGMLIALVLRQEREAAEHGRALLFRPRRAHQRHARQHRAGAELRPRRGRGVGDAQGRRPAARRPDAGAVLVGDRRGADARIDHAHDAGDPDRRHLPLHRGRDHGRRDRHVHELRHAC